MYTVQIPNLPTLDKPPSWCNLRGNPDRSACVEVKVAEVRRLAGCIIYQEPKRYPYALQRIGVRPLPFERAARNPAGRLATGLYVISADEVKYLTDSRMPRTLGGDFRTALSPAMRPDDWKPFDGEIDRQGFAALTRKRPRRERNRKGFRHRYTPNRRVLPYADFGLEANPNKGACRSKMIGIPTDWFQPLRIEKWAVNNACGVRYRLVCPGNPTTPGSLRYRKVLPEKPEVMKYDRWTFVDLPANDCWSLAKADFRFPRLTNALPGGRRPNCAQHASKLFLTMATEAEMRDARAAQAWIDSLPPRVYAAQMPTVAKLMDRYGTLFTPRTLLCLQCLGLRFGCHPDSIRLKSMRRSVRLRAAG